MRDMAGTRLSPELQVGARTARELLVIAGVQACNASTSTRGKMQAHPQNAEKPPICVIYLLVQGRSIVC